MSKITEVKARQVLDCKGRPVAEVDVVTESGFLGRAGASTGSSVGANESFVLRDGDPGIYGGMSVYKAIANIREVLAPAILGMDVQDQEAIDRKMIALDGTRYKTNLGEMPSTRFPWPWPRQPRRRTICLFTGIWRPGRSLIS